MQRGQRRQRALRSMGGEQAARSAQVAASAEQVEADLELTGVTAIEDKLQGGVPATIQTLLAARIKALLPERRHHPRSAPHTCRAMGCFGACHVTEQRRDDRDCFPL